MSHFPLSLTKMGESRMDLRNLFLTHAEERESGRMHAVLLSLCCSGHVGHGLELSVKDGDGRTPKCPESLCG